MAIYEDFTVHPYSKVIRHVSGKTSAYTVAQFYSWLMNYMDEPAYMTYQKPMKYNTPTSYTMLSGWFLDNGTGSELLKFLYGGSIQTTGYSTIDDPVYLLTYDTIATDFDSNDLDITVADDGTDVGPLLSYDLTNDKVWIRDTRAVPATISNGSQITMTTGADVDASADSITGDEIYTNIYTIAAFAGSPQPQVYIFQDGTRITEWSGYTNWDRDSAGVDVIIPVKLGGVVIDSGNVTVFVRQSADSYTYVTADLSGGSRTPVATETSSDTVNITIGEHYILYDGSDGGSSFVANEVIDNRNGAAVTAGTPPTWYAEVVSDSDYGDYGVLTLRGLRGTITDDDGIYSAGTLRATANGTVGDTLVLYDARSAGPVAGDVGAVCTGTAGAKRILRGYHDVNPSGYLVLQTSTAEDTVYGSDRDAYYKDFVDDDTLASTDTLSCTVNGDSVSLISGFNDVTVAHINGTVTTAGSFTGGPFIIGEMVTWDTRAGHAIVVDQVADTSLTLANVDNDQKDDITGDTLLGDLSGASMVADSNLIDDHTESFNFTLLSSYEYTVFIEGGSIYNTGRSLTDIYSYAQYILRDGSTSVISTSDGSDITPLEGQEYIRADSSYTPTKTAPYGTLAGGVFFGARGVWIQGMRSSDNNNIKLTDHNNNPREPLPSITVTISNTRVDDVITIFFNDGNDVPDKDMYISHDSNNVVGRSDYFDLFSAQLPNDTPLTGTFIVVSSGTNEEHRYRYTAWTASQLTLPTLVSGTTTSGSFNMLGESGNFASGVQRGDIIRNVTDGGWCYISEVTDDNTLATTPLSTGSSWDVGKAYQINALIETYDFSDRFFIPYMDTIESVGTDQAPGSESVDLLYVGDKDVIIRVRNVENVTPIQPFIATNTIGSTGMSVPVIRTEDEVYS